MFKQFADWLVYSVFNFDAASKAGASINFFVYDTIKIYFLVIAVIAIIAFFRTFLAPHKIKDILSRQKFGSGNLAAAFFGAITPFCSCSSIPIFIGFLKAEVPLGMAFSFLITSPLVNEIIFVMMGGMFGWKIAILYALAGIFLGVAAGLVLGKMNLEKELILDSAKNNGQDLTSGYLPKTLEGKIQFSLKESFSTFKSLWLYIMLGVAVGAAIHGYVPADFFRHYLNAASIWAVPLATLVGVPIYAGCSTVVPIIFAMFGQGAPLGTALAFLMAIAGLSLPEAIILKRVLSMRLLVTFFSAVAVGIIIIGYLFNLVSV